MSRRKIASNLMALYIMQGMQYVLPLLVLPILTRALGAELYGTLAFWQSLATGLSLITEYGFGYSAVRAVNLTQSDTERNTLFWATTFAKLALAMPAVAILIAVAITFGRSSDLHLVLASCLALAGTALSPAWYFVAIRRNAPVAGVGVLASLFVVAVMLVLVRDQGRFHTAVWLQLGLPALVSASLFAYLLRKASPGAPEWRPSRIVTQLKEGFPLFVSLLGAGAYSSFNPFLLGLVAPASQVAAYSLAERLSRAARNGVAPLLTAMFPYAVGNTRSDEPNRHLRRAATATFAISALITLALVLAAPIAVHLLAGKDFQEAVPLTRILAINIAVVTANHLIGVQYLIARGSERIVTIITVAAAPLHIATFLLACIRYGATGGAVVYVAVECLITATFVAVAAKLRKPT